MQSRYDAVKQQIQMTGSNDLSRQSYGVTLSHFLPYLLEIKLGFNHGFILLLNVDNEAWKKVHTRDH